MAEDETVLDSDTGTLLEDGHILISIDTHLQELTKQIGALVGVANQDMSNKVELEGRRNRLFMGAIGGSLLLLFAILLAISVANRQLLDDRAKVSDQVADCTTPGGECYEKGQDRLAELITEVNAQAQARTDKAVCTIKPEVCSNGVPVPAVPTTTTPTPTP